MTKLRKLNQIIVSLTLVCLLFFTTNVFAAENNIIAKGSTTVLPISQACAEIFMDQNMDIDISVQGGGSGVGIASIIDGTCDIGNASRAIKEKEARIKGRMPKSGGSYVGYQSFPKINSNSPSS